MSRDNSQADAPPGAANLLPHKLSLLPDWMPPLLVIAVVGLWVTGLDGINERDWPWHVLLLYVIGPPAIALNGLLMYAARDLCGQPGKRAAKVLVGGLIGALVFSFLATLTVKSVHFGLMMLSGCGAVTLLCVVGCFSGQVKEDHTAEGSSPPT